MWYDYSGRYIDRAVCLCWVMPYWEMPLQHTEGLNVLEQPWSRSLYEWNLILEPSFAYGMAVLAKKIYSRIGARKIILERTIRAVKSRKFYLRFEECDYRLVRRTLRSWMSESFWGNRIDGRVYVNLRYVTFFFEMLIAGLRREVAENCAVLGHYAASSGNFIRTFRDNLSIPSSWVH